MARKIIGTILVIAAGGLAFKILTGGGPVLPHIVGPITFAVIGVILLTFKKKTDPSAK